MHDSLNDQDEPLSRRHLFRNRRFTCLVVIALVIVVALILTPLTHRQKPEGGAEKRQAASECLKQAFGGHRPRIHSSANGDAIMSFESPAGISDNDLASLKELSKLDLALVWLDLRGTDVTGAGMIHLAAIPTLKHLFLAALPIDDEGVAHLKVLTELETLDLDRSLVSDAGIRHLIGLQSLEQLVLAQTNVTDESLVWLKQLPKLTRLVLDGTGVTDAGLIHVAEMKQLEELVLERTAVTDQGLVHLRSMPNLRRLSLAETDCSVEAIKELRQALPHCSIVD